MTTKSNIHIIKIFLNMFHLFLENEEISDIKTILDENNNPVGNLLIQDNQIIIDVENQNTILKANYKIPQTERINDLEDNTFVQLEFHQINFQLQNNEKTVNGEFQIDISNDSQLGFSYVPRVQLTSKENENTLRVNINQDGKIFEYNSNTENIRISPFLGEISHSITIGDYDIGKERFPYKLISAIFDKEDKYQIFMREEELQNILSYRNDSIPKTTEENLVIQGQLMQEIDPKMYETIQQLRKSFTFDNISLLDYLFNICYPKYTNEELHALLGINRETIQLGIKSYKKTN